MKQHKINLKLWLASLTLLAAAGIAGCKSSTEPLDTQYNDSQAAAEVTAAAIGDASGGAGATLNDAMTLAQGKSLQSTDASGREHVQSFIDTYDPTTMTHTIVVTRTKDWGNGFSYAGLWTYSYKLMDATGNGMKSYQQGVTDQLSISEKGGHTVVTPRVHVADSSNGSWTLKGLVNQATTAPIVNGTYNQAGSDSVQVGINAGRAITHTFQINHTNDQLFKDALSGFTYLIGTGNSNFSAVNLKGGTFTRSTAITFNADGTATLAVTRTSGNGSVDSFTIDVKQGFWLR